jgi:hypothetical protein
LILRPSCGRVHALRDGKFDSEGPRQQLALSGLLPHGVQARALALEKQMQAGPEGGEHEDYMIAQSALKALVKAGEAVKSARQQST